MNKLSKINSKINANFVALTIYTIHVVLNFLQNPGLKYFYIFSVIVFFFLVFTKKWNELVIPTFVLLYIEGQGRVITNYNLFFRNVFDIYLMLIMLRGFIEKRKFLDIKRIPKFFLIMIACHFLWYVVQIFNYKNVGVLAVVFASKIYIFPILMFFFFILEPYRLTGEEAKKFLGSILYIVILQVALIFFQMAMGEQHILRMSAYYSRIIGDKFSGILFRPFGTSFIVGGMAVPFAYTATILYWANTKSKLLSFFKMLAFIGMVFACIIMQVRTGLIQLIMIVFAINFVRGITSRMKYLVIPICLVAVNLLPVALENANKIQELFPEVDMSVSIARLQSLGDEKALKSSRASPLVVLDQLFYKLTRAPLGLGPGRTGAANSMFVDKIKSDLEFDMSYSWTYDNLWVSLAIDLGLGMIFYALVITLLPFYLMFKTLLEFMKTRRVDVMLLSCSITTGMILATNWGAIGIPYNPTSFFYWFFLAMGLNHLYSIGHKDYSA